MFKFFLQKLVILNMITDPFLVEKWGTLEVARRQDYKNVLNSGCQDCIRFGIFEVD